MSFQAIEALVWVGLVVALVTLLARRGRWRRVGGPGPGATGAVYDMLHEDKRKAIEIIVEGRAEERDEEHVDGNLPDLEAPARKS